MRNSSSLLFPLLIFLFFLLSPLSASPYYQDGVLIHLSSGRKSPQKVLMAFKMATIMSENKKDVLVYCDNEAVKLLTTDAQDIENSGFPSLHTMLDQLLSKKIPILACPACLKTAKIKYQNLKPGILIATPNTFFDFTKGRIVSLNY
ncbi:MAG: DsrE family protein [Chthoniobacterales bacterium]|nr:DsrE family protein [Chthoniobacterales bacterium]